MDWGRLNGRAGGKARRWESLQELASLYHWPLQPAGTWKGEDSPFWAHCCLSSQASWHGLQNWQKREKRPKEPWELQAPVQGFPWPIASESEAAQSCPTLCDPMDTRLLRPSDYLGKSTGVGCHFLLQGIFLTQGSNPGLPHCRETLCCPSHQGSPVILN